MWLGIVPDTLPNRLDGVRYIELSLLPFLPFIDRSEKYVELGRFCGALMRLMYNSAEAEVEMNCFLNKPIRATCAWLEALRAGEIRKRHDLKSVQVTARPVCYCAREVIRRPPARSTDLGQN